MSDIAISARGLGKRYRIGQHGDPYGRLTESLTAALRAPSRRRGAKSSVDIEWFWALREASFDLRHGDVVGVIGRNGAGKSTLLKILSRITEPTVGRAEIRGRVGSLLEVGTGFHPELTGRENVYMSGAVLGMRRAEIARKFDAIVDFAGVDQFLDTPIKRYSSGMQVRLGFAVAAHLEPDVLFIDEVLAVGDLAFQEKCLGKVGEIAREGRTVLFVSHNMGAVNVLCPTSMWLDGGAVRMIGNTSAVVSEFTRSIGDLSTGEVMIERDERRQAQITGARILSGGELVSAGECANPLTIEMALEVREKLPGLKAYLEVRQPAGVTVLMSESLDASPDPIGALPVGRYLVTATIPARTLAPGRYEVYVNLTSIGGTEFNVHSPGVIGAFNLYDSTTLRGNSRPGFFSTILEWRVAQDPSAPRPGPKAADGRGVADA